MCREVNNLLFCHPAIAIIFPFKLQFSLPTAQPHLSSEKTHLTKLFTRPTPESQTVQELKEKEKAKCECCPPRPQSPTLGFCASGYLFQGERQSISPSGPGMGFTVIYSLTKTQQLRPGCPEELAIMVLDSTASYISNDFVRKWQPHQI